MADFTFSMTLCNYNHSHYLPRALNGILSQSRLPDEFILVDDASTDNSYEIMREYASKYPMIRLVRNEVNKGATESVRIAHRMATGDFIQRAAADDYMLPGFIEKTMAIAERNPQVGAISTAFAHVRGFEDDTWDMDAAVPSRNPASFYFGLPALRPGYHLPEQYREYLEQDHCHPMTTLAPSTIYRRELINSLGGWPVDLGQAWEVSFMLHAAGLHSGFGYVDEPLYTWVYRPKSITENEISDLDHMQRLFQRFEQKTRESPYDKLYTDGFRRRWHKAATEWVANSTPKRQDRKATGVLAGLRRLLGH